MTTKYPTGARVTITTGTDIRGLSGVIEGRQGSVYIVRVGGKLVLLPASSLKRTEVAA